MVRGRPRGCVHSPQVFKRGESHFKVKDYPQGSVHSPQLLKREESHFNVKDHPQGSVHKPRLLRGEQNHFNVSWTNSHPKTQQESKVTEYSPSSTHHLQSQPVVKWAMLLGVFIKFMNFEFLS